MRLGENIRFYREKAGLSLRDLADLVGVTYATLSRYETGKTTPKYDVLQQIARAVGVDSVYYLYGDEDRGEYEKMMAERQQQITQNNLKMYAKQLAALNKPEGILLQAFYALGEDGQKALVEYADLLMASGKFK